jgi:hypothetical protein
MAWTDENAALDALTDASAHDMGAAPSPAARPPAAVIATVRRVLRTTIGRLLAATAITVAGAVVLFDVLPGPANPWLALALLLGWSVAVGSIAGSVIGGWVGLAGALAGLLITVGARWLLDPIPMSRWLSLGAYVPFVVLVLVGFGLGAIARRLRNRK